MVSPSVQYSTHPQPSLNITLSEPFLDVTVHETVRDAIEKQWHEGLASIRIDCSSLEFMDSSGVGLLVGLHRRLGGGAGRVCLVHVRPTIRGVLALLCLEDLFLFE